MATSVTPITLAEYLRTDYEPERELIAGELSAKPMPTRKHVLMAKRFEQLLEQYEKRGLGYVMRELSFRHDADVRIPDLVFHARESRFEDDILVDPPVLCIEILFPSQRQSRLFAKCEVYHSWGVPYCWVIDPVGKAAWEYHAERPVRLIEAGGQLTAGEIEVSHSEVFGQTTG